MMAELLCAFCRAPPMTVRASDLAPLQLVLDPRKRVLVSNRFRDREPLLPYVIELQHEDVVLTAIGARPCLEHTLDVQKVAELARSRRRQCCVRVATYDRSPGSLTVTGSAPMTVGADHLAFGDFDAQSRHGGPCRHEIGDPGALGAAYVIEVEGDDRCLPAIRTRRATEYVEDVEARSGSPSLTSRRHLATVLGTAVAEVRLEAALAPMLAAALRMPTEELDWKPPTAFPAVEEFPGEDRQADCPKRANEWRLDVPGPDAHRRQGYLEF